MENGPANLEKDGYSAENYRPLNDGCAGLMNKEHWVIASWKPTHESGLSIGTSEQIQHVVIVPLLAKSRASLKPSQREGETTVQFLVRGVLT